MEIPDFCTKAAPRVTRRRRTELDADPDYDPQVATSSSSRLSLGREKKQIRRSQLVVSNRMKPRPGLNFIDRVDHSIEDWKQLASTSSRSNNTGRGNAGNAAGIRKAVGEMADHLKDVDTDRLANLDYPVHDIKPFASENPYKRLVNNDGSDAEEDEDSTGIFELDKLPPYVMGTGRGNVGGPASEEFKTLWNYELLPLSRRVEYNDIDLPWEKEPAEKFIKPEILSIVACFTVGRTLNLKKIATSSPNVEYNPDRFAPLIMRIREPKSTGLIFGSGRIIVTGTRSEEECRRAARKYARVIQKLGYNVKVLNFDIQNISAACKLRFRVRLNHLSKNRFYGKLSYEPEMFPGLVISLVYPKVKVIVFCTGSVLMTGAKSEEDLTTAIRRVYPLLRMYAP